MSCSEWKLYVILDRSTMGERGLAEIACAAIRGGADVLQLRAKSAPARALMDDAARLLRLTRRAGVPLIINDRADVARAVGADGVHVGQDDVPVSDARSLLGPRAIIGKSTHSLEQALAAQAEGADYIGFGPIFPTPTKPEYGSVGLALIGEVRRRVRIPVVCIGGIDAAHLGEVLQAGAERVAVVRAICSATDPESAARILKEAIVQFAHTTSSTKL